MTTYFENVRGGFSIYCDGSADGSVPNVRFCLARVGEDPDLVLKFFHLEHARADFLLVPLFAHGMPPRAELCTARSLAAALGTLTLDPDGQVAKMWRDLCEEFNVAWPKRLARYTEKVA